MSLYVKIKKKFKGFSLNVEIDSSDKLLSIMGPSGSGKSMTLRCISGLIRPDEGIIRIGDNVVFDGSRGIDIPPRKRNIGFLFQNYALFPNMSVSENIRFGIKKSDAEGKELMDRIVKKFKIHELLDRKPAQLSGGQQQRVALARVVVPRPQIILLDEPFSALDEHLKLSLMSEMREALSEFEMRSVFVTHNIQEAYQMGSDLAIYYGGKIIDYGNKEELFNYPSSHEAARITGCKNIYDSHVLSMDDKSDDANLRSQPQKIHTSFVEVEVESLGIKALCTVCGDLNAKKTGKMYVRANHIIVSKYEELENIPRNTYVASVIDILPSPFRVTLFMKINGNEIIQTEISREIWQTIECDKVLITLPPAKTLFS